MGTLGGGNHFLEICADDEGAVWVMLHSGSRNIGKELAEYPHREAQKLPHNQDLLDRDLAVFVADTPQMDGLPAGISSGRRTTRGATARS